MAAICVNIQSWTHPDCQDMCPCLTTTKDEGRSCNLEKRRKDALSRALLVKLIWALLHTIIICSLFLADTDLTWAWKRPRFLYITAYTFLCITNLSFFIALCLANPGYLQKGVHALSLSTLKQDRKGGLADDIDIAEQGIGGLAHVDLSAGRRFLGLQKDKFRSSLDRTATMPSLPSQFSKFGCEEVCWDESPSLQDSKDYAAPHCTTFHCGSRPPLPTQDILISASDALSNLSFKANTMRTRGSSLGGIDEFNHAFKISSEKKERDSDEVEGSVLSNEEKRRNQECSTSSTERHDDLRAPLERRPSKPNSPVAFRKHDRQFWWEGPNPGRWCEFCGAWQLLRSRHCHDCGRCVRRFDHHCTWVGSCIGQDNHLMLWWYLLIQLTLLGWTLQVNLEAFRLPVALTLGRTAILLYCLVISSVMSVFVATLLAYHTYLVVTAQTTFELMLGHANSDINPAKVPYLKHLPADARPFSQGVVMNVLDFCCGTEGKLYSVPAALSARKSASDV